MGNAEKIQHAHTTNPSLPSESVITDVKEGAFSVLSAELRHKMRALGITNEDIVGILQSEDDISFYLELIDVFFEEIKAIYEAILQNTRDEYTRLEIPEEELLKEVKNNLLTKLTWHKELKVLFAKFPGIGKRIGFMSRGFNDLMDIAWYLRNKKGFEFSPDIYFRFAEINPGRSQDEYGNNRDPMDQITDVYDHLCEHIDNPDLFDDILKLNINTIESLNEIHKNTGYTPDRDKYIGRLTNTLSKIQEDRMPFFVEHYDAIIRLALACGHESSAFFFHYLRSYGGRGKDLENENTVAGLEVLGPYMIDVITSPSGFVRHMQERFPDRFVEMCQGLRMLCDATKNGKQVISQSLTNITEFIINNPDDWKFLIKAGEIFKESAPGVLRENIGLIKKLKSDYAERFEAILGEITERSENIRGGNRGEVLTSGLKFLTQFLDGGEDKFLEALGKLERIISENLEVPENTGTIFFRDGLDFLKYYMFWFPDKWEEIGKRIARLISKHRKNIDGEGVSFFRQYLQGFDQYIPYNLLDQDPEILHDFYDFLEKVAGNKDHIKLIQQMNLTLRKNPAFFKKYENTLSYAFAYLLRYKKNKVIPFIRLLKYLDDLDISLNLDALLFGGASLESLSDGTLSEMFSGDSVEGTKFWKYFLKIGGDRHRSIDEVQTQVSTIMPKEGKRMNREKILPVLRKIQNVFAELIFENFERVVEGKIKIKFQNEFSIEGDIDEKLFIEELLEVYKMFRNTPRNKEFAKQLIEKHLKSETYTGEGEVSEFYPYNIPENRKFLEDHLHYSAIPHWLSRNEKQYEVMTTNSVESPMERRIAHHMRVSHDKLQLLGIDENFSTPGKLIDYFDSTLKKDPSKFDKTIFTDLEFQIMEIKKLLKSSKSRQVSKISIYHELDPIKIAMMGNWVDGSCLSYYSPVGNYWSAITNALEVNKGVFYIEDEGGNIIGRVLVGIDGQNLKLEIHPVYTKGNIGFDLMPYVKQYMNELSENMHLNGTDGSRNYVRTLFCEGWYSGD